MKLERHHIDPTLKERDPERYWKFLPEDIIWVTRSEHKKIHYKLDPHFSEYDRTGENNGMFGKHQSNEQKRKSKETKMKNGTYGIKTKGSTGMHWYNNGTVDVFTYECPEGFVKGRLKGKNPYRDSNGKFSSANTEVNK